MAFSLYRKLYENITHKERERARWNNNNNENQQSIKAKESKSYVCCCWFFLCQSIYNSMKCGIGLGVRRIHRDSNMIMRCDTIFVYFFPSSFNKFFFSFFYEILAVPYSKFYSLLCLCVIFVFFFLCFVLISFHLFCVWRIYRRAL